MDETERKAFMKQLQPTPSIKLSLIIAWLSIIAINVGIFYLNVGLGWKFIIAGSIDLILMLLVSD